MSSVVELEYRMRIARQSPKERMARVSAMFLWSRDVLRRRVIREKGDMSPARLKWEVALLSYGSDPGMRRLIESQLANVSR